MAYHHIPCGECYYCRKQTFAQCEVYKKVGCTAGFAPSGGGFAEYIRVMDWIVRRGLVKIPDDVPFEQAAFIEPVNTCYKAIQLLDLQPDETVLVIGQGPIGILLAALARKTGATVLTSDLYPERHAIAARFGLEHPLDARGDVAAAAKAATEGRGADIALLAVGGDALIKVAMDAIRPGGRVVLFAQTQHGEAPFDPAAVCMDEKTLMGSYSSSVAFNEDVTRLVFDGYRNGFDLTNLISHRFSLEDAVAAIDLASHPQADSMKICDSAARLISCTFFNFDIEALDLLVQRGERNLEVLRGLGLVPVTALETIGDDAPLNLFHQIEEGGVRLMVQQAGRVGASGQLRRQQIGVMVREVESTTPRSMAFSSSRTLPGHS